MSATDACQGYRFGRFVLEPERRSLCAGTVLVPLGARAFDILLLLVRHHDRVVSKDEILSEVWRGTIVEENNLAVHISALRRALGERPGGDRFIATVSGLGYRFVGSVVDAALGATEAPVPTAAAVVAAIPDGERLPALAAPRREFRRIGALVAGALGLMAIVAGLLIEFRGGTATAPRLSIAVLPFRSLGGGGQDYLADAVTDDLTTDLSHIPSSTVIARGSAASFETQADNPVAIGHSLDVRYILKGSVLNEGTMLHVNAQLIDASVGEQLWANMFDVAREPLGNSLTEIVARISDAIRFKLVQVEGTRSLRERPRDPDALDLYLRARSILDRSNTLSGLVAAQALLEEAARIAPRNSDVLAELGLVLIRKTADFDDPHEADDYSKAAVFIDRATKIAPDNPLAITANGMQAWGDFRFREAEASFHLALSLDANDLEARSGLARCERDRGDMNAMIAELLDTLRIDPLGPGSARREHLIGMGYLMLGKPHEAIDWLNRAGAAIGDVSPDESSLGWQNWRRIYLIAATQLTGDHTTASDLYTDFARVWPHRTVFQLASYETRALSTLAGEKAYLGALQDAGMPVYVREDEDFGVAGTDSPVNGSDFDPTPLTAPGIRRVSTAAMESMLSSSTRPLILDLSPGVHVIPGAIAIPYQNSESGLLARLQQLKPTVSHDAVVVTMSQGPFGWGSYDAALRLVSLGFHNVYWYRGGEAAWVAAGNASEDRRLQ